MEDFDLEGLMAIVFSLAIPLAAVVGAYITAIKRKNRETELRKAIIENHVDAESIKVLIDEPQRGNKYTMLRWGCILLGTGLGAFASELLRHGGHYDPRLLFFCGACGMGVGMLVALIIENMMRKADRRADAATPPTEES